MHQIRTMLFTRFRRKPLVICVFLLFIFASVYIIYKNLTSNTRKIPCYKHSKSISNNIAKNAITYFVDILDAEKQPEIDKAIFFHETACHRTGIAKLNAKQACAIESAARWNPNRDIFVIYASPVGINYHTNKPIFIDKLWNYENIHFRTLDLWRYSKDTPVEEWSKTNKLFESYWLYEHMSDYLRAITLYRFGGFYMDLDVIVQKNYDNLGENFFVDDYGSVIGTSLIHLNNHGIGRKISGKYLERLTKNFDAADFIGNGPLILTEVGADICKTDQRSRWTRETCNGLELKSKEDFQPIEWKDFMMYFNASRLNETLEKTKNSTMIHVWNDRSKNIWNKIGTNNAYQVTAAKNCPMVYESSEYF